MTTIRPREGFTLVELLVATALIMFLMSILSEAFVAGTKAVRDLKAAGDLAERLRQASGILRRDLAADHFEGKKRLSHPDFWVNGPPAEGFFRVYQGSPPGSPSYFREGVDPTELMIKDSSRRLLDCYCATDHALHFTVKLRGNDPSDFFATVIDNPALPMFQPSILSPAERARRYMDAHNVYTSQWAEVVYFLRPTGDAAGRTPLFALYRRQFLAVDDVEGMTGKITAATPAAAQQSEISTHLEGRDLYFNTPRDLTMPNRRLAMVGGVYPFQTDASGLPTGADVLITDVVSMEVRLMLADGSRFESLYELVGMGSGNPRLSDGSRYVYPVLNGAFGVKGPLVFDTWSGSAGGVDDYTTWNTMGAPNHIPLFARTDNTRIGVRAVQIILRVWDVKTEMSRQITIDQEL